MKTQKLKLPLPLKQDSFLEIVTAIKIIDECKGACPKCGESLLRGPLYQSIAS
jgi:hypothetical protein